MSKRKERREKNELYEKVTRSAARLSVRDREAGPPHAGELFADQILALSRVFTPLLAAPAQRELPRMKKFRFQLLHEWIVASLAPGRMADVGGGKGLLAYLLQQDGWQATVIDPVHQTLPDKYKNIKTGRQTHIPSETLVARRNLPFSPDMAQDYDLLVALHAHGCNIQLVDAAASFGRDVILLPCCLIQEPLIPPPGVPWIQALADYAVQKGFTVLPFRLNFKGQNIGLYLHQG